MRKQQLYIIVYMVAVAAVFGAGVTGIYLASAATLRGNEVLAEQRGLVELFGLGAPAMMSKADLTETVARQVDDSEWCEDPVTGWRFRLLKAYADAGKQQLIAYGFRFRGLGFWAPIEGILAVSPSLDRTVGIAILAHKETPGLGGRIEEPVFTGQFRRGVTLSAPAGAQGKWIYIDAGSPTAGSSAYGRHVDAITGATQTSMAMARILDDFMGRFSRAMSARRSS